MTDYSRRGALYSLLDNIIGYDDGVTTPGERLGKGINDLGAGLLNDPVGLVGGLIGNTKRDLDNLMFEGGARERPEAVLGYAAAPMAPMSAPAGALRAGGIRAYHGSPHDFDRFKMESRGAGSTASIGRPALGDGAITLTTDADHARQYGDHLYETNLRITNPLTRNIRDDLEAWRASELPQYETVEEMLDDYYEGNLYDAANIDDVLHDGLREAREKGHDAFILDANGLEQDGGAVGKIISIWDENLIEIVRKYGIAGAAAMLGVTAAEVEAAVNQPQGLLD